MSERELEPVIARYLQELDAGRKPDRAQYLADHPDLAAELRGFFAGLDRMAQVAPDPTEVLPGAESALAPQTMLGPYRIEQVIGRGGMGTVYRAMHTYLQRPVAVKVLPARLSSDPQFVDRFKREARALAQLQHANIVAVHDMGMQDDRYYLVMELVDGVTLRQLIEQRALTAEQALSLVPRICQALEYAHSQGIVHRDIKPENILVDRSGQPKVADFGLARIVHGLALEPNLTRTSMVMGTLNYMAPEQRLTAHVDHRADIYALGVVLYEMLTGQVPGESFALPSERFPVDHRVDLVVSRALERDPAQRYQRASDMGQDVTQVIAPPSGGAQPSDQVIFHANTGERLGEARGVLRLIATGDDEIKIVGSMQPGVLIKVDGKPPVADTAADGVTIRLPKDEVVVEVFESLAVHVEASESDIETANLRAALDIASGSGSVTIKNHRGALRVARLGEGEVHVEGLESHDFLLATDAGALSVVGLRLRTGRGALRSQDGAVSIGVIADESAFSYSARSATGEIRATIGTRSESGSHAVRGQLGSGGGHLAVETTSGEIRLDSNRATLEVLDRRSYLDALDSLLWFGAFAAWIFLQLKWYWAGLGLIAYYGIKQLVAILVHDSRRSDT